MLRPQACWLLGLMTCAAVLFGARSANGACCWAYECEFQVSEIDYIFTKCGDCRCADVTGSCGEGCSVTNCGCSNCGAEPTCLDRGCQTCGTSEGKCADEDRSCKSDDNGSGRRRILKGAKVGGFSKPSSYSSGSSTTSKPATSSGGTTAVGRPAYTATGYPAGSVATGYPYTTSSAAFNGRAGYTGTPGSGYPGAGLPAGYSSRPSSYSYSRPYYRRPGSGLMLASPLFLFPFWMGMGHAYRGGYYRGDDYYRSLEDQELSLAIGNGTQSCQKVMMVRYNATALVTREEVRVYFDCIDKNLDGGIDFEEFCLEYGCYGDPGERFASESAAMDAFDALDGDDKDGLMSPGEFDAQLGDDNAAAGATGGLGAWAVGLVLLHSIGLAALAL